MLAHNLRYLPELFHYYISAYFMHVFLCFAAYISVTNQVAGRYRSASLSKIRLHRLKQKQPIGEEGGGGMDG